MPETPLIACSIGSTTDVDISSGLAPGSDRATLTVAGSAFGNRSTPRPRNENGPEHHERHHQHRGEDRDGGRRVQTACGLSLTSSRRRDSPPSSVSTSVTATRSPAFTPLDDFDAVAEALADLQLAHRQLVAVRRRTRG